MSAVSGLWTQSERLWSPGITADKTRETYEEVRESLEGKATSADEKTMDEMFDSIIEQTTPQAITTSSIIMLVFESMSLFAAYLMYNLQKRGYYLYLGGMAVALFGPLLLIGGWLGAITGMASIVLSVFMLILYSIHLKYMHS